MDEITNHLKKKGSGAYVATHTLSHTLAEASTHAATTQTENDLHVVGGLCQESHMWAFDQVWRCKLNPLWPQANEASGLSHFLWCVCERRIHALIDRVCHRVRLERSPMHPGIHPGSCGRANRAERRTSCSRWCRGCPRGCDLQENRNHPWVISRPLQDPPAALLIPHKPPT